MAEFMDTDCLIIGNTIVGDILKDGFVLEKDNPLCDELFVLDEIAELISYKESNYNSFRRGLGKIILRLYVCKSS